MNTEKMITVGELIALLQEMPQHLPVLVSGGRNGFDHFFSPIVINVIHQPENMPPEGEFQNIGRYDTAPTIAVVVLSRWSNDD